MESQTHLLSDERADGSPQQRGQQIDDEVVVGAGERDRAPAEKQGHEARTQVPRGVEATSQQECKLYRVGVKLLELTLYTICISSIKSITTEK